MVMASRLKILRHDCSQFRRSLKQVYEPFVLRSTANLLIVESGLLNKTKHHTRVVQKHGGNQERFPFSQKFRNFQNGGEWYRNFLRKFQKILKQLNFRKANHSTEKSRRKVKWNGASRQEISENIGIPQKIQSSLSDGNSSNLPRDQFPGWSHIRDLNMCRFRHQVAGLFPGSFGEKQGFFPPTFLEHHRWQIIPSVTSRKACLPLSLLCPSSIVVQIILLSGQTMARIGVSLVLLPANRGQPRQCTMLNAILSNGAVGGGGINSVHVLFATGNFQKCKRNFWWNGNRQAFPQISGYFLGDTSLDVSKILRKYHDIQNIKVSFLCNTGLKTQNFIKNI